MSTISKKICLVGDFGVGKTSLIRRFVEREFSDQYLSTVGVKISRKTIELPQKIEQKFEKLQLMIWDLEGHTKFKAIAPSYLQGGSGAIIVADVTRQETIDRLEEHLNLFLSINPKGFIIIAFNKSDLFDEEKMEKLLTTYDFSQQAQVLSSYATSAKTGKDVDIIFEQLAYKIVFPE
ncbi:GTP-binding protein [Phormidium sp. LEGE 05292]|uniref:Rab family GTPase n=1 Tax=[Phormidium] sp. LEGE 05292 TaxID=767427 RepID=UPI00187DE091|nr:Rab family GTPase [Phormidium sp. LEGE 05292]MBE9225090.1 GTP-binding protein [Phormidium sp. LEGE 05292]